MDGRPVPAEPPTNSPADAGAAAAFGDGASRAAWNAGAHAFDAFVESGADYYRLLVHGPGLLAACEPVAGTVTLDLGCGAGYFSRELARRGARVTGVDLADEMIALAKRREAETPLGIDYRRLSATAVHDEWPAGQFELVTACMALQDFADVPGALRSAAAVLAVGGRMVFSVPHPCTDTPVRDWERDSTGAKVALKVDRYFDSGPAICHWNMARLVSPWSTPYWRYTLAEWSALISDAGFVIRRLHEPRPTAAEVQKMPALDDSWRLPYFLVFDLVKQSLG